MFVFSKRSLKIMSNDYNDSLIGLFGYLIGAIVVCVSLLTLMPGCVTNTGLFISHGNSTLHLERSMNSSNGDE